MSEEGNVDGWSFSKIFQPIGQLNLPTEAIARGRIIGKRPSHGDIQRYPWTFVQLQGGGGIFSGIRKFFDRP